MTLRNIILDCDPGLDDAFAILLALSSPDKFNLLGITTVAGNVGLKYTTQNALGICQIADIRDIPIFSGCDRAIMGRGSRAPEIHGQNGIGGVSLPKPKFALQKQHAVDFIIETCLNADDGTITLCPIGPMTNIALAIIKQSAIIPKIKQIIFMGGAAFKAGNITPHAEFNIHADPHAAEVILQSGIDCVMFGLDVTHQAIITDQRLSDIKNIDGDIGNILSDMMSYYAAATKKAGGEQANGVLHDPCVIAYLIDPDIFQGSTHHIMVETALGHDKIGNIIVDGDGKKNNVKIITKMDAVKFYDLLITRISSLVS